MYWLSGAVPSGSKQSLHTSEAADAPWQALPAQPAATRTHSLPFPNLWHRCTVAPVMLLMHRSAVGESVSEPHQQPGCKDSQIQGQPQTQHVQTPIQATGGLVKGSSRIIITAFKHHMAPPSRHASIVGNVTQVLSSTWYVTMLLADGVIKVVRGNERHAMYLKLCRGYCGCLLLLQRKVCKPALQILAPLFRQTDLQLLRLHVRLPH